MKWIPFLTLALLAACDSKPDANDIQAAATRKSMAEAERQIGMPSITNFQERRLAKMIFELRDQEDLTTYAYLVSLEGKLVYLGRCIGYGLPYSVQYTNPMATSWSSRKGRATLPQADPNGLFMPSGLSATWLMLVDEKTGDARPVYVEPPIVVSPFRIPSGRE